jgi:hypothetical protein
MCGPSLDDLALVSPATPPEGDGGDHGTPAVEEFVKLVLVRGERLTGASQGTAHFGPAAANTRIDGLGGVDVFDVRGSELVEEALWIAVDQPLAVDPAHDPDAHGTGLRCSFHAFHFPVWVSSGFAYERLRTCSTTPLARD